MKTEALLSWLNVESNESYDSIRIKYQLRLEALEKEERIKKWEVSILLRLKYPLTTPG